MVSRRLAAFLVIIVAQAAHAGAWLQPEGKGLLISNATYYRTGQYFDAEGDKRRQPHYRKFEFQPYVEYGLYSNLTIGATAYVDQLRQAGNSNVGIADPELFVRHKLWSDGTQTLSIQPLIKFSSHFTDDHSPRAGSRSTDVELSLLYGRSQPFITANDYVDARLGYRARNHGLSDQVRLDATLGLKLTEQIEIMPTLRGVLAVNPQDIATYREDGELDYSFLKAELGGLYHLSTTQWVQTAIFAPVMGYQTGAGYGASVGFAQAF